MFGDILSSSESFSKVSEGIGDKEGETNPGNKVMLRSRKFAKLGKKFFAFHGTEHEDVLLWSKQLS